MRKPSVEPGRKSTLDKLLFNMPGIVEGKMFGYDAHDVNGKLFACISGDGVGVKVPEEIASTLLSEKHIIPFQPLDKPKMREWIQINRARPADYRKDIGIFSASVDFVSQIQTAKSNKK